MVSIRFGLALVIGAGLVASSGAANATIVSRLSTPFFVHPVIPDPRPRQTSERGILLTQPVSSVRAARLDAEAPAEAMGRPRPKPFPAGTPMFGAFAGQQWSYCAVVESNWGRPDKFSCYIDSDEDGRFDAVMDSGPPFNGVALFVFNTGQPRTLPEPVPYSRIDAAAGPRTRYAIGYRIHRPRAPDRNAQIPAATHISPIFGFLTADGALVPLSEQAAAVPLRDGQRARLEIKGALIEIDGVGDDNSVQYRVLRGVAGHVDQIMMQTVTTTVYY